MKRYIIAGAVGLLGIFLLPATKEFAEEIADMATSGLPSYESYTPFLTLVADHIFLVVCVLWVATIIAILFLGGKQAGEIQPRQ